MLTLRIKLLGVTSLLNDPDVEITQHQRQRRFLMCPPRHFDVAYASNPWMDPSQPVDRGCAMRQWESLVSAYAEHGHRVDLLEPVPGLPDMVFAANGATVVDGRVLVANFAVDQRRGEAARHADWHRRYGSSKDGYGLRELRTGVAVNEAEGDFAVLDGVVLAGHGFRTSLDAHRELHWLTGCEVISLALIDPHFYHLDTALTVLDDRAGLIAYYPDAFDEQSRQVLTRRFPDAVIATANDAAVLGLNCVSDGETVFLPAGADELGDQLSSRGYRVVPIDLSELLKAGGSVKCCTQEIRGHDPSPDAVS